MAQARSYRPAAFLRLYIRLEDFTNALADEAQSEANPYKQQIARAKKDITLLTEQQAQANGATPPDTATAAALGKEIKKQQRKVDALSKKSAAPAAQTPAKGDVFSVNFVTVPLDLTVEMNSFRIADTMSATFPLIDAPLMSYLIRSALVEVFLGTVKEEDFAEPEKWRLSPSGANLIFRGYVDSWDTTHTGEDSTVSIQARSLEAVLIDAKINPMAPDYRIKGDGEKITTFINRILGKLPATSGGGISGDQLKALWFHADPKAEPTLDRKGLARTLQSAKSQNKAAGATDGQDPPVAADTTDPSVPPGEVVGTGDVRMPPANPGQEMSVWDLITQACQIAGCLPTYDPSFKVTEDGRPAGAADEILAGLDNKKILSSADFIILRPPQTIYEDVTSGLTIPGGALDGFNRTFSNSDGSDLRSNIRFLVWGHNIKEFKTGRKLGRIKAPIIEVRTFNKDAAPGKRTISVRYPNTKIATRLGAKGEGPTEEVKTINIQTPVRDVKMLEQIAAGLYHSISRQELSCQIETDDLSSYVDPTRPLDHNENADVLKLRAGAAVRVTVAREVRDPALGVILSPLSEIFEKRTVELAKLIREQNGRFRASHDSNDGNLMAEEMANRIAAAITSAKLTDLFYVRTITHKFTASDGWSANMEVVNFIESRSLPRVLSGQDREIDEKTRVIKRTTKAITEAKKAETPAAAQERAERALKGY